MTFGPNAGIAVTRCAGRAGAPPGKPRAGGVPPWWSAAPPGRGAAPALGGAHERSDRPADSGRAHRAAGAVRPVTGPRAARAAPPTPLAARGTTGPRYVAACDRVGDRHLPVEHGGRAGAVDPADQVLQLRKHHRAHHLAWGHELGHTRPRNHARTAPAAAGGDDGRRGRRRRVRGRVARARRLGGLQEPDHAVVLVAASDTHGRAAARAKSIGEPCSTGHRPAGELTVQRPGRAAGFPPLRRPVVRSCQRAARRSARIW